MIKFLTRLSLPVFILGLTGYISACGQKGPLYVPVKPPAVSAPYPVAAQKENAKDSHLDSEKLPDEN